MKKGWNRYKKGITAIGVILAISSCSLLEESEDSADALALSSLLLLNNSGVSSSCTAGGSCKMFLTSATHDGNLSGVSGADALCNSDASKPSGGSTYKALIVDGTNRVACTSANCTTGGTSEHTDWVLKPSTRYVSADGGAEIFTTNSNGIFPFGNLTNQLSTTSAPWIAGMTSNWESTSNDCANWTDDAAGPEYLLGQGNATDSQFISGALILECDKTNRLLCVEQ